MDIQTALLHTRDATLPYFDLPAADLAKTYAPGKWSVRKILVHIADAESVLHERIKRTIAEPKSVVWAFDQDLWQDKLDYETFPLAVSKALYLANRESVRYLAEKYYLALGDNEFIHSQTGLRTLKHEFDKVAWHNQGHLDQIQTALNL